MQRAKTAAIYEQDFHAWAREQASGGGGGLGQHLPDRDALAGGQPSAVLELGRGVADGETVEIQGSATLCVAPPVG